MTARWVALGWASCLGLGLVGMVAVSGWAFMDHLESNGASKRTASLSSEPGGGLQVSMASLGSTPSDLSNSGPAVPLVASATPPQSSATTGATADIPIAHGTASNSRNPDILFDVRNGDSLSTLFEERGLSQQDLHQIVSSDNRVAEQLAALRPGDELRLQVSGIGNVLALAHIRGDADILNVERQTTGDYLARWTSAPTAASPEETLPNAAQVSGAAQTALERGLAESNWARREIRVANGDSLYGIFLEQGLAVAELIDLLRSGEDSRALKRLRPDQELDIYVDAELSVRHLVYHQDEIESLHFFRRDDGFSSERHRAELDRRLSSTNGEIRDSFYLAAQRAGLSDRLIMEMAEIFGWDIDFALDVRKGDRFAVIYEELYQADGTASEGAIMAAEFANRTRTFRALRYEDDDGQAQYYSPEGLSMRKAFLRTPVNFTRISSRFGLRKHPILHKLRNHNGVDYAAPHGTPVRATGDGRVAFAGRKGGFGKTLILKHGSSYTTLYAHLNGFAKGIGRSDAIQQGQVVAYVGSTGLATGPHLHYEFRVHDRHRDPLKVKLPDAPPIDQKYKADFLDRTQGLVARLEHLSRTHLASTN